VSSLFALALFCAALFAPPSAASAGAGPDSPHAPAYPAPDVARLEAYIDGYVRALQRHDHLAGAVVSVVHGDRMILAKGYGMDRPDGRPVDPARSLFRIGSISKTFTWALLLQLLEEGKVELDAPANRYLPQKARISDDGFAEPVRVRDLFCHSGGFEDQAAGLFFAAPEGLRPLADQLASHAPRRVRPPGLVSVYSNHGASLAGLVIETVRGRPFDDVAEERIFRPLGMARTSFREPYSADLASRLGLPAPLPAELAEDLATGFRWRQGQQQVRPFEYISANAPAGSVSATATDLARWMRALLRGGELEGRRVLQAATVVRLAQGSLCANTPGGNGLAWGFMESRSNGGHRAFGHGGNTLWFSSWMAVYPELDFGVFISGSSEGASRKLQLDLAPALADAFFPPPPAAAPSSASPVHDISRFAGDYLPDRRSFTTAEKVAAAPQLGRVAIDGGEVLVQSSGESIRFSPVDAVERAGARYVRLRSHETGELASFVERPGEPPRLLGIAGISQSTRVGFTDGVGLILAGLGGALVGGLLAVVAGILYLRRGPRGAGAALLLCGAGWLAAVAGLGVTAARMTDDVWNFVTGWPGAGLRLAGVASAAATLLWLASVLLLVRGRDWGSRRWTWVVALALLLLAACPWACWRWHLLGPIR